MSPVRRGANLIVGAALISAGGYLALLLTGSDHVPIKFALAAGALIFGGLACLGTGLLGR